MPIRLKRITLRGFKTIRELTEFEPRPINVLIGVNGAGKSNFISFFRMLSWLTAERLQEYVAGAGGAHTLLHDGPGVTREVEADLCLETESGDNDYGFRLFYGAGDALLFAEEKYRFSRSGFASPYRWNSLGAGHKEAQLLRQAEQDQTARVMLALLRKCIVHQFHDTSFQARIRGKWSEKDARYLKEDAANLGAFLLRLSRENPDHFRRIVETLRLILPFFYDFELEPDRYGQVLLQWREKDRDVVFDVSQASDGMLRTMAMVALLGQPPGDLPGVLILDEPELGLHPYAISIVAGMLGSAAKHVQVFLATQSATLVDNFQPEDVVVVERVARASTFRQLSPADLDAWLEEYTLGELWQKNVIGGRPSR